MNSGTLGHKPTSRVGGLLASLDLLAKASGQLLHPKSEVESIIPAVLDVAKAVIAADAYAVWHLSPSKDWRILASCGLSESYQAANIASAPNVPPSGPILVSDVFSSELVTARRELYESEGIGSFMAVPLVVRGEVAGTITFYYSAKHTFTDEEVTVATAVANLTAAALTNSALSREHELSKQRLEFLARASELIASSLDYETTLAAVTAVAVPQIADWCAIDICEDGKLVRLAIAHQDPSKIELAQEFTRLYPSDMASDQGRAGVMRSGKTSFFPLVTEEMLRAGARDERHLQMMMQLGFRSVLIVPLLARERVLGVLTLITSQRVMDEADVKLAEDLSHRAAVAIDNARLFKALRRSEEEARTLLNNMPDIVARYGRDLRYQYISPAVERVLGVSAGSFVGKTHEELGFPPHLCELFDNSVRKIFATGQQDRIEFAADDAEGSLKYMLGIGIPLFGPDGAVDCVLTISRDITQARVAADAVKKSEKELRLLTDALPALVAYVSNEQRFLRVNRTFEQWFGRPADYYIGKTIKETLGENYVNVEPYIARVLKGERVQFEATNKYADSIRHVLIAYVPDFDEDHNVRGFAALVQDVSERTQAIQAMQESEHRLRRFAEAGPAMLYSNLPDGYCDYVSQRFLDYTGKPPEEVLGYGWLTLVHPEDAENVQASWHRATMAGERHEDEFRFRRNDGVYRWFHTWNIPVRDDNGQIVRWFGTTMDVHEQKQAEDALRKTEKIAAVGRLAASISHEINNPLEAVTNLVFLARNNPGIPEEARAFLTTAERELARVSQIATQTLRFYRQSTRPTYTNIKELIDSVLSIYEGRLANSQLNLHVKAPRNGETVYAFEGELRQVLANLVGNAIDATPPGGTITIAACHCYRWSTGEKGVRITIADNGVGISPEMRARIFEPFFTTKQSTGTGLGLWVTREIIEKHSGFIRVRSRRTAGQSGTVFVVFLPDVVADVRASAV